MIWPTYAGGVGHLIDAILLFMLVTMTVVDIAKRTSVPKKAAWAVGIGLWIAIVVPLQQSGRLLFQNAWFAFLGFLILTLVLAGLLKGLFEKPFGKRAKIAQWVVAVCISVLAAGSIFAAVLRDLDIRSNQEEFIVSLMYAAIALALPLLFITAAILAYNLATKHKLGAGNKSTNTLDKARKTALDKQQKQQKKQQEERDLEEKHEKYLGELENQLNTFSEKVTEVNKQDLSTLQQINAYIKQLIESANEFEKTIKSYAKWLNNNSSKTASFLHKTKNKVGEDQGTARQLDKSYYEQLDQLADQWTRSVASLQETVNELRDRRTSLSFTKLDELNKQLRAEKKKYEKLIFKITKHANEAQQLEKRLRKPVRELLTEQPAAGMVRQAVQRDSQYQQLRSKIAQLEQNATHWQTRLEEGRGVVLKDRELLESLFAHLETLVNDLKKAYKKSHEAPQQISNHLHKTKQAITQGLKKISPEQMSQAIKELHKAHTETTKEISLVEKREEYLKDGREHHKRIQEVLEHAHNAYDQLLKEIGEDFQQAAALADFAEALADFEARLDAIDNMTEQGGRKNRFEKQRKTLRQQTTHLPKELKQILEPAKNLPDHQEVKKRLENLTASVYKKGEEAIKERQEKEVQLENKVGEQ